MKDRNYTGTLSDIREQSGVVIALSGSTIQTQQLLTMSARGQWTKPLAR